MRRLLLLLLLALLLPELARADVLKICFLGGDTQSAALCSAPDTAWDYFSDASDWIVANPSECDIVVLPGDLVDGRGFNLDCWCAAQPWTPEKPLCTDNTNPYTNEVCGISECNDPDAKICTGGQIDGVGGWWCEFERIRNTIDALTAAGVPVAWVNGNHDCDNQNSSHCERESKDYNLYFGAEKQSPLFTRGGTYEHTFPCSSLPSGVSEQADGSWHVLHAADADWLFIMIPWMEMRSTSTTYPGMTAETLAWIQSVIDMPENEKLPTFLVTHGMVSDVCATQEESDAYDATWCAQNQWQAYWTGNAVFDQILMDPVRGSGIVATFGGHIRSLAMGETLTTPYKTIGIGIDYTSPIAGAPAWQTYDNAGGGVVEILYVDTVAGEISARGYSPAEEEFVELGGDDPASRFKFKIPLCSDTTRFSFPAAACPEPEPSPTCCNK